MNVPLRLNRRRRHHREEFANALSHGIGALLASAMCALLPVFAAFYGSTRHVVGFSLFGASVVALYLSSTAYHTARNPRVKAALRILDHSAIYILIAGTYTPFAISAMSNAAGWWLFGTIWALALGGIAFKAIWGPRFRVVSSLVYLAMGWLVVFFLGPVRAAISSTSLLWLILGGVAYSSGVAFYLWKKLPYSHAVWHGFVLTGTLCHFFAVLYILPL